MRLLLRLLLTAAIIAGVAHFSSGTLIEVDGFGWALVAAVVLGLVNLIVKPVVKVLSLPITILTLGLFSLVVNALMLYLVAALTPGVRTTGFFATMVAAVLIALLSSILTRLLDKDE